ncbi:CoA transferase [Bordetella parapertussis]|uniref:CoA transferase n=2 Tax=Bordetella parapertussis TaxID=519 RepID=Q7WBK0_BORPA|nr:CaiB/BaiF CoA-transferase family protein [Bordetella parapertussis]AOB38284.1 CoA-transferase [Bordetella parapertussis]AUL42260.1 CoA transferase [Bordetella parapertussis]AWP62174.1 CoA transferase [Bordetella parapertussis]AWP69672.1 CoA transferase [Bordetella parapertussis]AWP88262.1 CoA transferase [Bordetella parapertussis]
MLHNALRGVKVLDLSRILAGPWCTQNLADMGAEVIKVEQPGSGDDTRGWGPPDQTSPDGQASMSAYFMACNRGKQSIELDFSWPDGAQTVRRLAAEADILVENFKAGGLAKYGLDYASLARVNPRLIYLSITGYGQSGPMAGKPGYDYVFQGMGGLMSYTGQPDGMPGAGPLRTGVAVVDLMTGMYATSAVLAALRQRDQTGQGLPLDICLLDVAVALNANQGANYLVSGKAPQRTGNAHPNCAPYEVFACADGHLILAIGNDGQFARFCKVVGHPEWAGDARYATNSARLEHMPTLRPMLAAALAGAPRQAWTDAFDAAGVPWGPIHTLDEVFAHPQVRHRELLQTVRHPVLGEMRLVRNPLLAGAPAHALQACPPLLGEHSAAVLGHDAAAARATEP